MDYCGRFAYAMDKLRILREDMLYYSSLTLGRMEAFILKFKFISYTHRLITVLIERLCPPAWAPILLDKGLCMMRDYLDWELEVHWFDCGLNCARFEDFSQRILEAAAGCLPKN